MGHGIGAAVRVWERSGRLSERTVRERERVLRVIRGQLGVPLREASARDVRRWWLRIAPGLAPASRAAYLSHLRAFYRDQGIPDPTAGIPVPRVPAGLPRPVSDADLGMALAMLEGDMGAIVALMGVCGLRCVEVAGLVPGDVLTGPDGRVSLRIRGKGDQVRVVPASLEVERRLAGYSWPALTAAQVSKAVGRALRGIGVDATAHQLRHAAATRFYRESGGNLLETARLLGHRNVRHTMIYAATDVASSRAVLDRLESF